MNKVFIVVLAVCLVNVHAFVKRDAPAAGKEEITLESIQKNIQELTKNVGEKFGEALSPEQMKKGFNDAVDQLNKAINDVKAKFSEGQKDKA